MITRAVMSLRDYLKHGRTDHQPMACFACGRIDHPRPIDPTDTGRERRCLHCGQQSALELPQAVSEGWLRILDDEGRIHNDRQVVVP